MTFGKSLSTCFSKFITFEGRASRSEFWWFHLFIVLGNLVCSVSPILLNIFCALLALPSIAVWVRRLHDRNKSGWWFLLGLTVIGGLVLFIWALQDSVEPNDYGELDED